MASAGNSLSAGFVLAGGASRRMGSNKALLRCSETTLVEHVSNQVRRAAGSVHVVGDGSKLGGVSLDIIEDLFPGEGPLGGIITALTYTTAEWNLVVACDMPAVSPEWLAQLLHTASATGRDAFVPVSPDGQEHPLCGVYRATALRGLRNAWDAGTRSAIRALGSIQTAYMPTGNTLPLINVNTPAEWDHFRDARC
jgi:molybdenum cofactor guanylyltransferase